MNFAKLGLLLFKVGDPKVKSDWVYVDNLVLALLLASMGLLDDIPGREGHPVAAGQSYFISDGNICKLSRKVNFSSYVFPIRVYLSIASPLRFRLTMSNNHVIAVLQGVQSILLSSSVLF